MNPRAEIYIVVLSILVLQLQYIPLDIYIYCSVWWMRHHKGLMDEIDEEHMYMCVCTYCTLRPTAQSQSSWVIYGRLYALVNVSSMSFLNVCPRKTLRKNCAWGQTQSSVWWAFCERLVSTDPSTYCRGKTSFKAIVLTYCGRLVYYALLFDITLSLATMALSRDLSHSHDSFNHLGKTTKKMTPNVWKSQLCNKVIIKGMRDFDDNFPPAFLLPKVFVCLVFGLFLCPSFMWNMKKKQNSLLYYYEKMQLFYSLRTDFVRIPAAPLSPYTPTSCFFPLSPNHTHLCLQLFIMYSNILYNQLKLLWS